MTDFASLADELLAAEFDAYPTRASALGVAEYDGRLDDLSADAFRRRDAEAEAWTRRLEAVPDDGPHAGRAPRSRPCHRHPPRPDDPGRLGRLAARPARLFHAMPRRHLQAPPPPAPAGRSARRRDRQPPRGRARRPRGRAAEPGCHAREPLIAERGVASARGGLRYLRDLLPRGVRRRVPSATGFATRRDRPARPSSDGSPSSTSSSPGPTGDWRLGEERYTRLLRERESLSDDARSLRDRGQAEYDRLDAEMRELARAVDGTEDWVAVLERTDEDHPPTEEAMRAAYEDWTARSRGFLEETGLVTLPPGERCVVEPSPVFQRPVLGRGLVRGSADVLATRSRATSSSRSRRTGRRPTRSRSGSRPTATAASPPPPSTRRTRAITGTCR